MSHSRKKWPFYWRSGLSAKKDKQYSNRKFRRITRERLKTNLYEHETLLLPLYKELIDQWDWNVGTKCNWFFNEIDARSFSSIHYYFKIMRK